MQAGGGGVMVYGDVGGRDVASDADVRCGEACVRRCILQLRCA